MTREWEKHLKATRFLRSRPNGNGEVSVYRRRPDGELQFERIEKAAGAQPRPAISSR